MKRKQQRRTPTQGLLVIQEALDAYGDMSMADFVDLALAHGLMPLNVHLSPYDELAVHPQRQTTPTLSAQRELAS